MNNQSVNKSGTTNSMTVKASYSVPTLRVYGSINKLTMGGIGTKIDGVNSTKKN